METVVDASQQRLDRLALLEIRRARIEPEEVVLMLEFADLRRGEAECQPDLRVRDLQTNVVPMSSSPRCSATTAAMTPASPPARVR